MPHHSFISVKPIDHYLINLFYNIYLLLYFCLSTLNTYNKIVTLPMNVRKLLLMLLCTSMPVLLFAQSDSTKKKVPLFKRPPNSTKLELTYDKIEYYNSRYGYQTKYIPGVRIDDARPVRIDRKGEMLRKYYVKAPLANEQLDLMNQQRRRGTAQMLPTVIGGALVAFSGVFASAGDDSKSGQFWPRFGIGAGMVVTGVILKAYHSKKADEHFRQSLAIYNARYYKPAPADTSRKNTSPPTAKDTLAKTKPLTPEQIYSERYPEFKDSVNYVLLRNEPEKSGMAGIIFTPVTIDLNASNPNISAGLGAFYTFKSDFGASVHYDIAYLDNIRGSHGIKAPTEYYEVQGGIPVKYQRANRLELQFKVPLFRFNKEDNYHISVTGMKVGKVKGEVMRAITGRVGYILDRRLLDGSTDKPFQTNTTAINYPGTENPMSFGNLAWSTAMMRSNIITFGLGWSKFRDIQIQLADPDYHGRRMEKAQTDLYIDVLYAHQLKLQDIIYWHPISFEAGVLPQRVDISATPLRKAGVRIGSQRISSFSDHWGLKMGVELGLSPGPKMDRLDDQLYGKLVVGVVFGGRFVSGN